MSRTGHDFGALRRSAVLPAKAASRQALLQHLRGFRRTTADFLNGLSLSFSILQPWVGVLALLAVRHRPGTRGKCGR